MSRPRAFATLLLLAGSAIIALASVACANSTAAADHADDAGVADYGGDASAAADSGSDGAVDSGPKPSLGGRAFVAHDISLGDVGPDGGADPNAWATVGMNIDGVDTGIDGGLPGCDLVLGASPDVSVDGENGIDNSFAKNVLPVFASLGGSDFSASLTQSIETGGPTLMIDLQGLTDDPAQTASPLDAQLLSVTHLGRPAWDGTDAWDVYMSSLVDGAISKGARARFATSSITNGTWSTGVAGDVPLTLAFGGVSIDILVHHAQVSFHHDSAHHASGGVVAGVINTSEFVAALQPLFKQIGACPYTYALNPEIEAASDILDDGTNKSGVACNAISIGIGFTADEALSPNSVTGDPVPGSACP